jgi:hypothetical protein
MLQGNQPELAGPYVQSSRLNKHIRKLFPCIVYGLLPNRFAVNRDYSRGVVNFGGDLAGQKRDRVAQQETSKPME